MLLWHCLEALCDAQAAITLVTACSVMIATINNIEPSIFWKKGTDGQPFRCFDTYVKTFLHKKLSWSVRSATQAGQKIPLNWESQCLKSILCLAYSIKEHDIPSALYVNTDQTQVVLAQGTNLTWTKAGSHQVAVVGEGEKRAFTLVVSISNDGVLLPFQTVHQGCSAKVTPSKTADNYDDAINAGFQFEFQKQPHTGQCIEQCIP